MSEAAAVIFGALIGAGGAIVAQITTAIATARRDGSRLDWEKERQDSEWGLREEERFLAVKQEVYASLGAAVNDFLSYMDLVRPDYDGPDLPALKQPDLEPLGRIRSNIELMAPEEVSRLAGLCVLRITVTIWALNANDITADDLSQAYREAASTWLNTRDAMRRDLHSCTQRFRQPAPSAAESVADDDIPDPLRRAPRTGAVWPTGSPSTVRSPTFPCTSA